MPQSPNPFVIGSYRPIYLWGGPGTIRINRLKFMDAGVDEKAHLEIHGPEGAVKVIDELYCNWVYLMYNWGFPPEVEAQDWDSFEKGAQYYHERNTKIFAYIQTSNFVYEGSFQDKDWFALNTQGEKITYFAFKGRYMACLANPDWKQHLKDLIQGAIERGADGIFFDNMFQGAITVSMFGIWMGPVGCHCPICQQGFYRDSGQMIPTAVDIEESTTARYLSWRADQVTQLIVELADYANELQLGTPISGNDHNFMTSNSYLLYGLDLAALAEVQDVIMIENFALPHWDNGSEPRLANNALNIRSAREQVRGKAHLSMLAYDIAIGTDPVYTIRRYKQGIAEGLACGTSTTTKGTEYFDGQKMTVLTAPEYQEVREAIGDYNRWLESNAQYFSEDRINLAQVGLLFPEKTLWLDWHKLAPLYFDAGQTLTMEGIPWRVVRAGDTLHGLASLLVFDLADLKAVTTSVDTEIIYIPELVGWQPAQPSIIARHAYLQQIVSQAFKTGMKMYGKYKPIRRMADKFEASKIVNQTYNHIPEEDSRKTLLTALPENIYPRIKSDEPALIEFWECGDEIQVHLVNYASKHQDVFVQFPEAVYVTAVSPDGEDNNIYQGNPIRMPVNIYKILFLPSKK